MNSKARPKSLHAVVLALFLGILLLVAGGCEEGEAILNFSQTFVKEDEWATTLKNTGTAKLRVLGLAMVAGNFELKNPNGCEKTYNPNDSCTVYTFNEVPGVGGVLTVEWEQWVGGAWVPAVHHTQGIPA